MHIAEQHWGKRSAGGYALRTQLDRGAVLALGSDCPVETLDPLAGHPCRRHPPPGRRHARSRRVVSRAASDGRAGRARVLPRVRRTRPAWKTGWAAWRPGKLADLTILDQDIFTIDPMEILNTRVLATLTAGRFAWRDSSL